MTTGNHPGQQGANGALVTSNGHGSDSPEQIEREIEETRARMEQTIAAIRHDLSPGQLIDQALHAFRSGKVGDTVRRAGSSLGDVVKEHPAPIALIGIGITWLAVSSSSSRSAASGRGVTAEPSGAPEMSEPAESTASRMTERIEGKAQQWKGRASGYAHTATERARTTSKQAQEQARRARDASSRAYEENPLLMGIAAVGIGALVGALFPSTPQEGRLLGDKRDRLLRKADESAGRALHKVTEKIEEHGQMQGGQMEGGQREGGQMEGAPMTGASSSGATMGGVATTSTLPPDAPYEAPGAPPSQPSGMDTGPAADVYGDETRKR